MQTNGSQNADLASRNRAIASADRLAGLKAAGARAQLGTIADVAFEPADLTEYDITRNRAIDQAYQLYLAGGADPRD